jgi:hypothetical protein
MSSGHAFAVVDRVASLNYCLYNYKMTPTYALKFARLSIKENIARIFSRERATSTSTFNKFVDEDVAQMGAAPMTE